MSVIACHNITKTFPVGFSGRVKKTALDNLSFEVNRNEVFGIIGPNGAGKSTIIKILMGFVRPDSGIALLAEQPVSRHTCHQFVGYLPENPSLYRQLSLSDHLRFAARTAGMSGEQTNKRIEEIAKTVDLWDTRSSPINSFSKGMTQRAALAYALFLDPEVLILDEPMSGLDPCGRQLVVDIIKKIHQKGTTILLCSHILTDVERICTQIAIMDKSRLVTMTTPDKLQSLSEPRIGMTPLEAFFFETISSNCQ